MNIDYCLDGTTGTETNINKLYAKFSARWPEWCQGNDDECFYIYRNKAEKKLNKPIAVFTIEP